MPVSATALATLGDVHSHLLEAHVSLAGDVFADGAPFEDEGIAIIEAASDRVREYLSRDVIAREYTVYLDEQEDWTRAMRSPAGADLELAARHIEAWPVLYVEEDVTVVRDRRVYASESQAELTYIAGWRRPDQVLSDLSQPVQDALNSDSDVPVMPDAIRRATVVIAAARAVQQIQGLEGASSTRLEQGDFSTDVSRERADQSSERNALRSIQQYRYIV